MAGTPAPSLATVAQSIMWQNAAKWDAPSVAVNTITCEVAGAHEGVLHAVCVPVCDGRVVGSAPSCGGGGCTARPGPVLFAVGLTMRGANLGCRM